MDRKMERLVLTLLRQEESEIHDFKLMIPLDKRGKYELAKDVSGFANGKGGFLFIGVRKNDRKVVGTPVPLETDKLTQIISSRTYPSVSVTIESKKRGADRYLGVIHIPQGKTVHMIWPEKDVYLRRGSITERASIQEIAQLYAEREQSPRTILDTHSSKPILENASIVILPDSEMSYRTIRKWGKFHPLADCPVFLPDFTVHLKAPEFGKTKSPLRVAYQYPKSLPHPTFLQKVRNVEELILKMSTYFDTYQRLYWSISAEGKLTYGCGVKNLQKALDAGCLGVVSLATCGEYSGGIASSFILVIGGYCKYRNEGTTLVSNPTIDLYLSTIPVSHDWIQTLFEPFIGENKLYFHALAYQPAHVSLKVWSAVDTLKPSPTIKGVIRRYKHFKDGEFEIGAVIADCRWYSPENFSFSEPWADTKTKSGMFGSWFGEMADETRSPVELMDECLVTPTNPLVTFEGVRSKTVRSFKGPTIRQYTVDGYGHIVHIVGIDARPSSDGEDEPEGTDDFKL